MDTIVNAMRSMNPWWANKPFQKGGIIEREIQKPVLESLKLRQIKDIIGVRRSGKTTLLQLIIWDLIRQGVKPSKIFFLSFDEINLGTAGFEDIEKAIAQIEIEPEYLFWTKCRRKSIGKNGLSRSMTQKDSGKFLSQGQMPAYCQKMLENF